MPPFTNLTKFTILSFFLVAATFAMAQDGTIYPLEAPAEPNAILLGTGGVEGQPARETWFRQWGDPMARNISTATLTPFLPKPDKANGAAVIVAPGGGFRWLSMTFSLLSRAIDQKNLQAYQSSQRIALTTF